MIVYKLKSLEVAQKYDNYKIKNRVLEFVLDGNGDLIFGQEVLEDPTWAHISEELKDNSEKIEYVTTENKDAELALIKDKFQKLKQAVK